MSFFVPPGPTIPGSTNLSSATVGTSTLANQGDINISTVNGSVKLTVGTNVYVWPTTPPPNPSYVLGIGSYSTVDGITTYNLEWVMGSICFHVSTKVIRLGSGEVTMDKLKYGDKVLVLDDGMIFFSEIVDFTGVFPTRNGPHIKIFHSHGEPLIVSNTHLIHAEGKFMKASELQIGMKLTSCSNKVFITKSEITHIEHGFSTGWYTPLTKTGTIIVNNIVASCHTVGPHNMVRFMYKPLYFYLKMYPRTKGEFPKETEHWFSIKFRRGPVGRFVEKCLRFFKWE